MTRIVCLNGEFVPEDEARIPIMDRGLLFADAIYEGMGVLDGGIVDVRKHLARLRRSLAEVGIPEPHTEEEFLGILMELVRRNDVDEGFLYLHVTRGVAAHSRLAQGCDRFIAFELGPMFVPYGRIYPLDAYRGLLDIDACIGAKHSSLERSPEWDRLALRDEVRPDFHVFTGNDLAIDMVRYGSDYLLGLSTFGPDVFAERDRRWAAGDGAGFGELNDLLQELGDLAFREPVPGYRHNAAQFLKLRGWIGSDQVPQGAVRRPDTDLEALTDLGHRLGVLG